jgi:hypothetical protein
LPSPRNCGRSSSAEAIQGDRREQRRKLQAGHRTDDSTERPQRTAVTPRRRHGDLSLSVLVQNDG